MLRGRSTPRSPVPVAGPDVGGAWEERAVDVARVLSFEVVALSHIREIGHAMPDVYKYSRDPNKANYVVSSYLT